MEALLLTVALVVLMVGTLVLLARTWPRSSRSGGYRAGRGAGRDASGGSDTGTVVPEDDDAHWRWTDQDAQGSSDRDPGHGRDEQA